MSEVFISNARRKAPPGDTGVPGLWAAGRGDGPSTSETIATNSCVSRHSPETLCLQYQGRVSTLNLFFD